MLDANQVIPGLDLGPYLAGQPEAVDALAKQLRHTCENVGFFYIENHGVPQDLIDRTFEQSRRFHALPLEDKLRLKINHDNVGYMPVNASMQKHSKVEQARHPNYNASYFCFRERSPDDRDFRAGKPFCGPNQWPQNLPGFREQVIEYQRALEQLGLRMLPLIARSLELPDDYFAPYFNPPQFSLRMLHYPVRDESVPGQFGTGAHTDAGFLTFLAQGDVPGLQIRTTSGEWLDAPVLKGRFLVNTGDIFRKWTNDRYLSTPHRVLNVSGTERYSMAFFFGMHLERLIECLPTCQSPDNPPRHQPFTYLSYKTEFLNTNYFHRQGSATGSEASQTTQRDRT
jgi:isopenicillin N synthase-like dioxygenase